MEMQKSTLKMSEFIETSN